MEHRRVILQMTLELYLVELCMVKGAEACCQAPECSDKPELQIEQLAEETELRLLRKVQAILGFTLHLNERISRLDSREIKPNRLYTAYVRSPILLAISKA